MCTVTPFLWFYDRMQNSHFYYSSLLLASMCFSPSAGATLGLRLTSQRIQNTHLRTSSKGPATASRLQARHPTPSGSSRTLISPFPPARPQHTRVVCLSQGTRPHDIGVPDPLPRALTLIARTGRCSPALQQLLSSPELQRQLSRDSSDSFRVQHLQVTLPDALRPIPTTNLLLMPTV